MLDHLHDVPEGALEQQDEISRRRAGDDEPQLIDDRLRRARPLRALPVGEKPPSPQASIDLAPQPHQVAGRARRHETQMTLEIRMTIDRRREHRPQLADRQVLREQRERERARGRGYGFE